MTVTNNPEDGAKSRDRVLSDAELVAVWNGCQDDAYGSGQRREEVGAMSWPELNRDAGTWTIPADRAKNGREHTLTLPTMAWAIIDSVPHRTWSEYLFGRVHGFNGWGTAKAAIDKRCGIAPWVIHDLRRIVVTGWPISASSRTSSRLC